MTDEVSGESLRGALILVLFCFFSLVCLVVFPMRRVGFYGDLSALQDFVLDF